MSTEKRLTVRLRPETGKFLDDASSHDDDSLNHSLEILLGACRRAGFQSIREVADYLALKGKGRG